MAPLMLRAVRRTLCRAAHAWRSESGAELLEFALLLPVLLMLVLALFDFGFTFQQYEVVTNAAREGARIAILPAYTATDVQNRVAAYIAAGGLTGTPTTTVTTVTITTGAGGPTMTGQQVSVQYPHQFVFLGPIANFFFGGNFGTVNLTAVSTMRTEIAATGS